MYELKVKNGEVIHSITDSDHVFIIIDGVEYKLDTVVNHFKKKHTEQIFITATDILEFESDLEMQKMIEASEEDIKYGRVYSSKEVLGKIRNGEL